MTGEGTRHSGALPPLLPQEIDRVEAALPRVFTPASPISEPALLKGRDEILDDIRRAYFRKGASIVLWGEPGVGKTSIAKVASSLIDGDHFYYSASAKDSFESVAMGILRKYDASWVDDTREVSERTGGQGGLSLPMVTAQFERTRSVSRHEVQLSRTPITPHGVAVRLPKKPGLIVIDDFERIVPKGRREYFGEFIKKLSDNEVPLTAMFVGIAQNVGELITGHISAARSVVEIRAPRLNDADIRRIVTDGMEALGISIDPGCIDQIVNFSARFPYYTHLLCEGAVRSLNSFHRFGVVHHPVLRREGLDPGKGDAACMKARASVIRASIVGQRWLRVTLS